MTWSIIINEGKPDEEFDGLFREYYLPTPSYEGVFVDELKKLIVTDILPKFTEYIKQNK